MWPFKFTPKPVKRTLTQKLDEAEDKISGLKKNQFWTAYELSVPEIVTLVCPAFKGTHAIVRRKEKGHTGKHLTTAQRLYLFIHGVKRQNLWNVPGSELTKRKPS